MCYYDGYTVKKTTERINTIQFYFYAAVKIITKILVTACLLCHISCAQNLHSVRDKKVENTPTILQDILISGAGNNIKIEIIANKPLQYKFYNIAEPPRGVVDIYPALLNPFKNPLIVNSPLVSQIDIKKLNIDGRSATRIIFKLKQPVVFSVSEEPSNKNNILLTVAKTKEGAKDGSSSKTDSSHTGQASNRNNPIVALNSGETGMPTPFGFFSGIVKTSSPTNAVLVEAPQKKNLMFSETDKKHLYKPVELGQTSDWMTIYKVHVIGNGVEIVVSGVDKNFKFIRLRKPARLVLDIFGAKNALKNTFIPVDNFGIKAIRLSSYPYKVRIVFDSTRKFFPAYKVEVDDLGMKLLF